MRITRYRLWIFIAVWAFTILIDLHVTIEDTQNRFAMITTIALIACTWMLAFNKNSKHDL